MRYIDYDWTEDWEAATEHKPYKNKLEKPILKFSPTAWAKIIFMRDFGDTEIAGFGISSDEDLLLVEDFVTIKQEACSASFEMDDDAVAEFFEEQVDLGRNPREFARILLHTHPGNSASPSGVDWEVFNRVFDECDWAIMFVLANGGDTDGTLMFSGIRGMTSIDYYIDYESEFDATDHESWEREYIENIHKKIYIPQTRIRNNPNVSKHINNNQAYNRSQLSLPAHKDLDYEHYISELDDIIDLTEENEREDFKEACRTLGIPVAK